DFADAHRARLGICPHRVRSDTGRHRLIEISLHPHALHEGLRAPFVGGLHDLFHGVHIVAAVRANEPARWNHRSRLHLAAGYAHEADAALGAGLEIAHLLVGADTEADHAVRRHENSILDIEGADFH